MSEALHFGAHALVIGVGATLLLDLWTALMSRLGIAAPNWRLVGRWIGHFPRGRFTHDDVSAAEAIPGEHVIGWTAHYVIGAAYAALLMTLAGPAWAQEPTLLPALLFGWATLVAPFFIMQPGMGAGIAASRTPKPDAARLKSLMSHTVFGFGLYAAAFAAAFVF